MKRREWLRSAVAAGAGIPLGLSMFQELAAAPASKAEFELFKSFKSNPKMVRLGSNENPYGPSPKAREAIKTSILEGNRYGFESGEELKAMIAAKEGVPLEQVLVFAGSGEALAITGLTVGVEGGSILSAWPTFPLGMKRIHFNKANVVFLQYEVKLNLGLA